jgi:hypothetical protein
MVRQNLHILAISYNLAKMHITPGNLAFSGVTQTIDS